MNERMTAPKVIHKHVLVPNDGVDINRDARQEPLERKPGEAKTNVEVEDAASSLLSTGAIGEMAEVMDSTDDALGSAEASVILNGLSLDAEEILESIALRMRDQKLYLLHAKREREYALLDILHDTPPPSQAAVASAYFQASPPVGWPKGAEITGVIMPGPRVAEAVRAALEAEDSRHQQVEDEAEAGYQGPDHS